MKQCKCISNIVKAQLKGKSRTGKKVIMFEFTDDAIGDFMSFATGKSTGTKTKSTIRYQLEGEKKVKSTYMHHQFCPFCGSEYKKK